MMSVRTIQKLQAVLALSLNLDLSRAVCCTPQLGEDQVCLALLSYLIGVVSDLESEEDGVCCRCLHSQFQVCNPQWPQCRRWDWTRYLAAV